MSLNLCSVQGGNTGGTDCDDKRGRPVQPIVGGKQFTSSEYADSDTFSAAMVAALALDNGNASKLFAFPEIKKVANNTPASTSGNLPFGPVRRLSKGIPAYTYTVEIGWFEYQNLLAYDGKTVPVFTRDDKSNTWGYRAAPARNTVNTNVFKGELMYVTIEGSGFEDGENVETGTAKISMSAISVEDFEKRGSYINTPDLATGDLKGLRDVTLTEPSAHVSNVYKIKASIMLPKLGSDLNIYDDHGVALAAATWTAFTGATFGTSLAITSIAVDATNKCLTVTLDSTAYGVLASGAKIKLVPPTVAVLTAAGVTGLEIGYIILTK